MGFLLNFVKRTMMHVINLYYAAFHETSWTPSHRLRALCPLSRAGLAIQKRMVKVSLINKQTQDRIKQAIAH